MLKLYRTFHFPIGFLVKLILFLVFFIILQLETL